MQRTDSPGNNILMGRKQVVGQGFPVRQRQQFQPVFADGRPIFFRGQPEEEAHGLLKPYGVGGAAGNDQGQAPVGTGTFTDGQRVTAAVQLAPDPVIGRS